MFARSPLLAALLFAASITNAVAQSRSDAVARDRSDVIAPPTLRANVTVTSDIVRIGDLVDNAGSFGATPIYRAPDLGTTGALPVAQVLAALRTHQVIGVDTRDLKEISVTRAVRAIERQEIEQAVARTLERRNGLGEAANLNISFDRDVGDVRLEATNSGNLQPVALRYDARNNRFDVTFEIANETGAAPARLRFTGIAVETIEAAVLARNVERGEVLKHSDVVVERRAKSEVGTDLALRDTAVGMQARRQLRTGQALKTADLVRPDLVTRDQSVTLIYQAAGLYLTIRGKALDGGTEGDVVSVMNLQSKRVVSGTVTGRGQVTITAPRAAPAPEPTASLAPAGQANPVAVANVSSVASKAE
ncbi:flagellar basal body P-ring formation protein FlgA [Bradyrhizobium sp. BRP22]|uniref:flagellar basal body P-ring formation chaperone FlgA n=1 Tax=Bradyrhizobium sp. BRP22 TaxID=2793821 RepID=UPI001CD6E8A5|nr:flagellar basal body P-ring formation chaperone FlgA [Bradyrhizobium sp. BRP22]MCA1458342.1 flagellar basal body P-ring formation protein FlgA [Bradyrhizobium sp. BRP22]